MDLNKLLDELRQERAQIEALVLSLERLAHTRNKRCGWMVSGDLNRSPRRPPKASRAGAALKIPRHTADAIGRLRK